jgi:hypothetical protein
MTLSKASEGSGASGGATPFTIEGDWVGRGEVALDDSPGKADRIVACRCKRGVFGLHPHESTILYAWMPRHCRGFGFLRGHRAHFSLATQDFLAEVFRRFSSFGR